ncbi:MULTISPECIES: hypothetical protein [Anaeromyxobacter]|uniref:hypothetical protein n=1 Tax=Anaeromyxobacter TaxID=161492 RepID=UPI001F5A517D|nr:MULTISPECIES: hypothetical protein [unclassified Anaeromyxobacter]
MGKISAAILDTAEPFITALPDHASAVAREDAIRLGVLIWNALVCQRLGDPEPFREALARFRALPEPQCTVMATLVAQVVERKVERYADDVRMVRDWKLTQRENGEATLWAEAVTSRP